MTPAQHLALIAAIIYQPPPVDLLKAKFIERAIEDAQDLINEAEAIIVQESLDAQAALEEAQEETGPEAPW